MAAGYASFVNGGKQVKYTLIDRIQDRWGKTIWRYDGDRACPDCNAEKWEGQTEPTLPADEFDVLKRQSIANAEEQLNNPASLAIARVRRSGGK